MQFKEIFTSVALACVTVASAGWTQQSPHYRNRPAHSVTPSNMIARQNHWTGNLVDTECMSNALGGRHNLYAVVEPLMNVPHVVGDPAARPSTGQVPTQPGTASPSGQTSKPVHRVHRPNLSSETDQTSQYSSVDLNEDQRTQLERVNRVESAAGNCGASPLTQSLGLAMADGNVVKFDQDSCVKVRGALKDANPLPGRKVTAKVTGTVDDESVVRVAAVDVRTRGK